MELIAKSPPKLKSLLNKQFIPIEQGYFTGVCEFFHINKHISINIFHQNSYPCQSTASLNDNIWSLKQIICKPRLLFTFIIPTLITKLHILLHIYS